MSRISVIGAGIAGMCAAARLSRLGHEVEIFEASGHIGGKCRTEWINDLAFDSGPTLLTLPAVFRDFFLKTGSAMESVVTLTSVDPSFDYRFVDGSRVEFSNLSRFRTLSAIENTFGKESASDWAALMKRASDIWDISRTPFIESEQPSLGSLLRSQTLLRDIKIISPWRSLESLVSQKTNDYRLKYIIDRYATYSGSDPRRAPAAFLSIAYIEEAFGAWHVQGGFGQLAQAIHHRAVETGVKVHLNSPVIHINAESNSVNGITLADGSIIESDIVIANADSSTVYSSLLSTKEKALRRTKRRLKRADPSVAGFSLFLGTREGASTPKISHHNVLFPSTYRNEFVSIFDKGKPANEPAIYICAPSDSHMTRNSGKSGWSVLVNVPRHSTTGDGWNWDDDKFSHQYAKKIIDQIEKRGIPVRDHMELLAIKTPADLEREVRAPGGSIYGTSSNGVRAAFHRTPNRSPLTGLFCVGGSTHPGGGLPLVAISAEIVSGIIGRA